MNYDPPRVRILMVPQLDELPDVSGVHQNLTRVGDGAFRQVSPVALIDLLVAVFTSLAAVGFWRPRKDDRPRSGFARPSSRLAQFSPIPTGRVGGSTSPAQLFSGWN